MEQDNIQNLELVGRAMVFSIKAHDRMRRKASEVPYIVHPMEAAAIVSSMTGKQEVIAAAVLHDVVEDTPVTLADVEAAFGPRVAELVAADTEDKRVHLPPEESWFDRKLETVVALKNSTDLEAKMLILGDKLSNMRSIYLQWSEKGDAFWKNGFHQTDPSVQHWYYRSIADALPELKNTLAWREYDGLIRAIFEGGAEE